MRADGPWAAGLVDVAAWGAFAAVPLLGLVQVGRIAAAVPDAPTGAILALGSLAGLAAATPFAGRPRPGLILFTGLLVAGGIAGSSLVATRSLAALALLSGGLGGIARLHAALLEQLAAPALAPRIAGWGRLAGGGLALGIALLWPHGLPIAAAALLGALLLFTATDPGRSAPGSRGGGLAAWLAGDMLAMLLPALVALPLAPGASLALGILALQATTFLPARPAGTRVPRSLVGLLACTKLAAVSPTVVAPIVWALVATLAGGRGAAAAGIAGIAAVAAVAATGRGRGSDAGPHV